MRNERDALRDILAAADPADLLTVANWIGAEPDPAMVAGLIVAGLDPIRHGYPAAGRPLAERQARPEK